MLTIKSTAIDLTVFQSTCPSRDDQLTMSMPPRVVAAAAGVLLLFGAGIVILSPDRAAQSDSQLPPTSGVSTVLVAATQRGPAHTALVSAPGPKHSTRHDTMGSADNNSMLVVPLVNKDLVEYFGDIYIGTPGQKFTVISPLQPRGLMHDAAKVTFDTGSGTLWVPSATCTSCDSSTTTRDKYNGQASSTFVDLKG